MSTPYRFQIVLSDVDRGVYRTLDLRPALHPSETPGFMVARVLAAALCQPTTEDEVIAFSKGGLSSPDEAALTVCALDGSLRVWIDVGVPSAERIHRASKAAPHVVIVTHKDPSQLQGEVRGKKIHRAEELEVWAVAPSFVDLLAGALERTNRWEITRSDGTLYITIGDRVLEGAVIKVILETQK